MTFSGNRKKGMDRIGLVSPPRNSYREVSCLETHLSNNFSTACSQSLVQKSVGDLHCGSVAQLATLFEGSIAGPFLTEPGSPESVLLIRPEGVSHVLGIVAAATIWVMSARTGIRATRKKNSMAITKSRQSQRRIHMRTSLTQQGAT